MFNRLNIVLNRYNLIKRMMRWTYHSNDYRIFLAGLRNDIFSFLDCETLSDALNHMNAFYTFMGRILSDLYRLT